MKNIFEYLQTDEGIINEKVFESFSHWMFEGNDVTSRLSRFFLRWSILYMIQNPENEKPDNDNFFAFFQEFDRTDFDSFLNHLSHDAIIAVQIEQTLGSDQTGEFSGDNQASYWYFLGIIADHIESKNLFPELPVAKSTQLKTNPEEDKVEIPAGTGEPLSEEGQKKLSGVFSMIFFVLVAVFFFYNFFL